MRRSLSKLTICLTLALAMLIPLLAITPLHCGSGATTPQSTSSSTASDLLESTNQVLDSTNEALKNLSVKLAIVFAIIALLGLMFFRDSRKIAAVFTTILCIAGAFFGIQILTNGWITNFLMEIANKYFN